MNKLQKTQSSDQNMKLRLYICLAIMICLQLTVIIYCFATKKQGFHSDEIWSYGYANSYYQKDIYANPDGTSINMGEWINSDVLKDYLVVNDGEGFEYGSIYQNQIIDLSPPLHSMMLHTICSFFPNSFSKWYAFSINIVSFLVCMIFLFKLSVLILDEKRAMYVCGIYGFCRAAVDNFCYLRMYAFCTALSVIIIYYMLLVMKDEKNKELWKHMAILFCVSGIAFLTHYYMISTAGLFTACMCLYLICAKKIKRMFQLGFTMLGSLVGSLVVFPSILNRAQSQTQTMGESNSEFMNYNFDIRNRILWNFIASKTVGIKISIFKNNWYMIALGYLVVAIIMSIPLIFLFRDTKFIKNCKEKIIYFFKNIKAIMKNLFLKFVHETNWYVVALFVVCVCEVIVVGQTSDVYHMGNFEDRYLFNLSPLFVIFCVAVVTFLCRILPLIKRLQKWIVLGLCLFVVANNLRVVHLGSFYFFDRYAEGENIESVCEDHNVVYVENVRWFLTSMCPYLMNSKEYLMLDANQCMENPDMLLEKMKGEPLYVIIDLSNFQSELSQFNDKVSMDSETEDEYDEDGLNKEYQELEEYLENLDNTTEMKKLGENRFQGRTMRMFVINPQD